MANARQAWWLSRDRFEGMVPSGIDQRRMGGLYRVDGSGASEDPAIDRSIETPLETSYNCPVCPRSKPTLCMTVCDETARRIVGCQRGVHE